MWQPQYVSLFEFIPGIFPPPLCFKIRHGRKLYRWRVDKPEVKEKQQEL